MNILQDVADSKASFSDSLRLRTKETGKTLQKKAAAKLGEIINGYGYKKKARGRRKAQSKKKLLPNSTGKIRKKQRKRAVEKNNKK